MELLKNRLRTSCAPAEEGERREIEEGRSIQQSV